MSFNKLPPELLSPILLNKAIPLQQKIRLRRVATSWLNILEADLKKRTKLIIYGNRDGCKRAKDDLVLSEGQFRQEFVQLITDLFPRLIELSVSTFSRASYEQLAALLPPYRNTLTTLSLTGHNYPTCSCWNTIYATPSLIDALNALPNLTSLKFSEYRFTVELLFALAPTLSRLERLSVYHANCRDYVGLPIFICLSTRCTHLVVPVTFLSWEHPRVGESLVSLAVDVFSDHPRFIGLRDDIVIAMSVDFPALRQFRVNYPRWFLDTDRVRKMTPLQQLTELKLIGLIFLSDGGLIPPQEGDLPMVNLKKLSLGLIVDHNFGYVTYHGVCHFWSRITAWFPSLESFTIRCRDDIGIFKSALESVETDCVISVVFDGRMI